MNGIPGQVVETSCLPHSPLQTLIFHRGWVSLENFHFSSRLEQTPVPNTSGNGPLKKLLQQLANEVWKEVSHITYWSAVEEGESVAEK